MRIANCGLRIADRGMPKSDHALTNLHTDSAFRIPHSAFRNPKSPIDLGFFLSKFAPFLDATAAIVR